MSALVMAIALIAMEANLWPTSPRVTTAIIFLSLFLIATVNDVLLLIDRARRFT